MHSAGDVCTQSVGNIAGWSFPWEKRRMRNLSRQTIDSHFLSIVRKHRSTAETPELQRTVRT